MGIIRLKKTVRLALDYYVTAALDLVCYATIISGTLDLANERGRQLGETLFGNAMRSLTELNAFDLL